MVIPSTLNVMLQFHGRNLTALTPEVCNLILYSMLLLLLSTFLDLWKDAFLTLRNANFYSNNSSKQPVLELVQQ